MELLFEFVAVVIVGKIDLLGTGLDISIVGISDAFTALAEGFASLEQLEANMYNMMGKIILNLLANAGLKLNIFIIALFTFWIRRDNYF